jgi:undecaprenyl-diphosphatase
MDSGFYLGKEGIMVIGILLGITFILKRYWQELAMLAIGLSGASSLFYALTALFDRARPPTQIWIMVNLPGFPSGHAVSTFVLFGLLAYLIAPKMRSTFWKVVVVLAAVFIIAFVGFSRVFTAGHYLTDVLAGYSVGIAWSAAAFTLIEIYFQKRRRQNAKKE